GTPRRSARGRARRRRAVALARRGAPPRRSGGSRRLRRRRRHGATRPPVVRSRASRQRARSARGRSRCRLPARHLPRRPHRSPRLLPRRPPPGPLRPPQKRVLRLKPALRFSELVAKAPARQGSPIFLVSKREIARVATQKILATLGVVASWRRARRKA